MIKPTKRPAKRIAPSALKTKKQKDIKKWLKTPKAKKIISKLIKESNKKVEILEKAKKPPYPVYGKK